ncbi:hypothetical protein SCATT_50660 [Streptantibioticus cattleyicolor NRRL 8057 = DSM 46488]|uniref:Uncharacterized protein n=1 Tax=Streptantibioticus cattleyicolor (strain ATCC 35852 / DSM 46488 / JCM 4925 / NBRC 14057 / NRRL 8057) TaxID=1003195 RepID=G8X3R2_STREN|nr:hypothetical protein SCATT_50660 [Streptantibioticus cattleyicolor NRRL 8057 = DSM 46488]
MSCRACHVRCVAIGTLCPVRHVGIVVRENAAPPRIACAQQA